ncbi:farnesol dehydrogenase [Microplitis demolitor]|uniref:farnesol dehydrogenase n=1 Tax=Microplitis demolitor TaxID=69319 RepID=UPI0004400156|nr:farnesol dehydrogenase [Microplitis demolitor]
MDRWRGKIAVVTGACSGIGRAITVSLLCKEINVIGLDINVQEFTKIKEKVSSTPRAGFFNGIECDISRIKDISDAFDTIEKQFSGVDILINNAGVSDYRRIFDADRESFERLLNINVLAVATCTRAAIQSMRDKGVQGHIININSVLGHEIPMKGLSEKDGSNSYNLYPACKHATVAMTHSIRRELSEAKLGIKITSISPGLVKTNIASKTNLKNLFDEIPALEPEDVADAVLYALGTRPHVQISELTIQRTGEP